MSLAVVVSSGAWEAFSKMLDIGKDLEGVSIEGVNETALRVRVRKSAIAEVGRC